MNSWWIGSHDSPVLTFLKRSTKKTYRLTFPNPVFKADDNKEPVRPHHSLMVLTCTSFWEKLCLWCPTNCLHWTHVSEPEHTNPPRKPQRHEGPRSEVSLGSISVLSSTTSVLAWSLNITTCSRSSPFPRSGHKWAIFALIASFPSPGAYRGEVEDSGSKSTCCGLQVSRSKTQLFIQKQGCLVSV
jgi:hypothetical protein